MRPRLSLALTGLALAALLLKPALAPIFVLNLSASVPVGLYRLDRHDPNRGELAVIELGRPWHALAASRGYILPVFRLIKPVAALAGDTICRTGGRITINGHPAAIAQRVDTNGRSLPVWEGCKTLIEGELFLLSDVKGSFDGRYFGITPRSALIARAVPVPGWFAE